MEPSRSVPGTVAELLDELVVTAELTLSHEGRQLQLRADGDHLSISVDAYRDLLALRSGPHTALSPGMIADIGLKPVIVVRDREVASVRMGDAAPWWQHFLGIRRRVDVRWVSVVKSLLPS